MARIREKTLKFPGLNNTYTFADEADLFDANVDCAVGEYYIYNGDLYRCKKSHTGAWKESDFVSVKIGNETGKLNNAVFETLTGTAVYGYDDITWTGAYINANGTEVTHAAYKLSDYFAVEEDDIVEYDGLRSPTTSQLIIAAYDETKTFIADNSVRGSGSSDTGTYTVPSGVAYIRVSTYNYTGELYFRSLKIPYCTEASKISAIESSVEDIQSEQIEQNERISALEGSFEYTVTSFDDFDITTPGGITLTGGDWDYQYAVRSDYISTENIVSITARIKAVNRYECAVASYDENKNFIAAKSLICNDLSETSGSWIYVSGTITIGDDVKYIRITRGSSEGINSDDTISVTKIRTLIEDYTVTKDEVNTLVENATIWKGKKWYAFGTSLTDSSYLDPNGDPTGKYPAYLNEYLQAELINKGKGGGGITSHSNGSILTTIQNTDFSDADLITLEGFPNDYSAAPGDFTDTTTDTLCGALYVALSAIYQRAPNATVVIITASQGQLNEQGTSGYPIDFVSATGNRQVEYNQAIIKMGQYFGCHVIDAGGKSQINNFHPDYLVDHLHHSFLGGKQYAETIWEELKNIHCNTDVTVN